MSFPSRSLCLANLYRSVSTPTLSFFIFLITKAILHTTILSYYTIYTSCGPSVCLYLHSYRSYDFFAKSATSGKPPSDVKRRMVQASTSTENDLFMTPTISEVFYFYVAVTEQNQKVYFYIGQSLSWSSAQNYCREHYLDLAMIENQEENTRAGSAAPSSPLTWIGLYREPWTWSDQSHSTFRNNNPAGLTNPREPFVACMISNHHVLVHCQQ
uniref:C-type lectin domain-containing protein n=1 Tax=Oryzias latipes TaxID=8090 RepID=A0A3P9IAF6_ORYLA